MSFLSMEGCKYIAVSYFAATDIQFLLIMLQIKL